MNTKLKYLILLMVLATLGIVIIQVNWLKKSYQISKEKITSEAKMVLDEAIVEHKELVAERVRFLLKKVINPKDIETRVFNQYPNSQNVSLHYRTKRYPNASWTSFKVPLKQLIKVQDNPYPLLLKSINEGNLDVLEGVYSTFVGIVHYEPNSLEEKLQDSLMRCFYLHEDTAALNKIIKNRFEKLNYQLITQVIHQQGIDKIYNKESALNQKNSDQSEKVVEMVMTEKRRQTLTEQLDSLNLYLQKLSKNEKQIFIAKPILDDINTILTSKISVIILVINITPSIILQQMIFSLIGSTLLLLLMVFCLTYMFNLILKQKKLAEMKDDFISNVSHELKTPVATTLSAIQGMQYFGVLEDKKRTNQYLETAANEMKRLSNMIDTILNSVIYERNHIELNLVQFNLKEMLTNMIEVLQMHSQKEVIIELNYVAPKEIFADQTLFYQVILNLIDNAIKYSKAKAVIMIACKQTAIGISIQISDNGIGIPKEYQQHIFDKFFRVPTPNDHRVKGHGLGLNYVKNIIEKHHGTVSLFKSDETGSTFEITLPQ